MQAKLPFANDGSFFEQFKALQEKQQQQQQQKSETEAVAAADTAEAPETATAQPSTSVPEQDAGPRAEAEAQSTKVSVAANQASTSNQDPDFQPSSSFTGARPGFCFKLGAHGVGYYLDTPLHLQFKQQAAAKPVVLKGNKPIVRVGGKAAAGAAGDSKKRKLGEGTAQQVHQSPTRGPPGLPCSKACGMCTAAMHQQLLTPTQQPLVELVTLHHQPAALPQAGLL
jgi:hypothetical protein